jgi:glycosyltransferase involved in cell wall biosynthesis
MLWSILIAAIPERYHSAHGLLHSLLEQQSVARMQDVELIYCMDNRRRCVGAKRNDLLAMAKGEYVSFVDDDDEVASDYVQKIYRAITKARKLEKVEDAAGVVVAMGGPIAPTDVICFPQRATLIPANVIHECTYSIKHWKDRKPEERRQLAPTDKPNTLAWSGPPAHTMIWRREIVKDIKFPEKNFGEDVDWVDAACELAKSEMVLNGEPLYYYKFDEAKTSTR